jgi:hypothetical protein
MQQKHLASYRLVTKTSTIRTDVKEIREISYIYSGLSGHAVAQLVEALLYEEEGRGADPGVRAGLRREFVAASLLGLRVRILVGGKEVCVVLYSKDKGTSHNNQTKKEVRKKSKQTSELMHKTKNKKKSRGVFEIFH